MARQPVQLPGRRVVVGVDPSLAATGICGVVDGAAQVTDVFVTISGQHRPARLIEQRERLHSFLIASRGQVREGGQFLVAMEAEIWMGNPTQSGDASAIQAMYQTLLWQLDPQHQWLHYLPVNAAQVKKWLGAREKNEILLQVFKRYGREFQNDNAADAFTIAMIGDSYAAYVLDGVTWPEWTKPQVEVLDKLRATGFPWERAPQPRGKHRKTLAPG